MLSVTWIEPLGWMLVHSVWLIALIVGVATIAFVGLRRCSANARYVTGCAALWLSLVALPSSFAWVMVTHEVVPEKSLDNAQSGWHALTIGKGVDDEAGSRDQDVAELMRVRNEWPSPSDRSLTTSATDPHTSSGVEIVAASTPSVWRRVESQLRPHLAKLVAVWLGGVVLLSLRPLIGWRASRRLRRVGLSDVPNSVTKTLTELSARLGVRRAIQIFKSSLVQIPCVIGAVKPIILLPASAITGLSAEQLEAVLAHELAHIRRHDYLVNVLQTLVETICFYHPAVWWLSRQIRVEREHCCDDVVLTLLNDRAEYCRALVAIEELRGRSTLLALGATDGSLLARVRRIVGVAPDGAAARLSDRWPVAFVGLVTLGIVLTITLGTLTASRAENEKPAADERVTNEVNDSAQPDSQPKTADDAPRRLNQLTTGHGIKLACSADGKLIAVANGNPTRIAQVGGTSRVAGAWKPTADILNVETGKSVVSLKLTTADEDALLAETGRVPPVEVTALAFSPDGSVVAVGTSVGQVKLFRARTGELIRSLDDEPARLADKRTPKNLQSLRRAMGSVGSLAFSPDGSLLAICGGSLNEIAEPLVREKLLRFTERVTGPGRLKVWEVKTGSLKHDLVGLTDANAVSFSPDGNLLASAGNWAEGSGVILWNPQTGAKILTLTNKANAGAYAVAFSPNSKVIVFGSRQYDQANDTYTMAVSLASVPAGITRWQQQFSDGAIPKTAFSPDGKSVLVLGKQSIRVLDTESGIVQREIKSDDLSAAGRWDDFAVAPHGPWLVIGTVDKYEGTVELWDFNRLGTAAGSGAPKQDKPDKRWRIKGVRNRLWKDHGGDGP